MASFYFYYSAMNAGKTTSLLQTDHNYHERGMKTVIFNNAIDTRYGQGIIKSRIGLQKNAMTYDKDFDFFCYMKDAKNVSCVLIDEAQFLTRKQVDQLGDVAHQCLFGPDDRRRFKAFFPENAGVVAQFAVADARNSGGNIENACAQLADDQIRLVARRHGNQHVRVGSTGIRENLRAGGIADNAAQVKALLKGVDVLRVQVDNRDVVGFGDQTFSNGRPDSACADNQNFHMPVAEPLSEGFLP